MLLRFDRRQNLIFGVAAVSLVGFIAFFYALQPASGKSVISEDSTSERFFIERGESFDAIVDRLHERGFIKSTFAFKVLALATGNARDLKPGSYNLSSSWSTPAILDLLVRGAHREVEIRIPEGASLDEIDTLLSAQGVIPNGELTNSDRKKLWEGRFFPDTYKFFTGSSIEEVAKKFLANFEAKAAPLLDKDPSQLERNLILASLLEKEIPDFEEKRIAAGILKKRVQNGIPLQVDATICYSKRQRDNGSGDSCHPVTYLDLKIDSPYNTYLYAGWPPGPIGSPGIDAIKAALSPRSSPYWYYLSDPVSKKTIFAQTLDEHNRNKVQYLD